MQKWIRQILAAVLMGTVLPGIMIWGLGKVQKVKTPDRTVLTVTETTRELPEESTAPGQEQMISVMAPDGVPRQMELDAYLTGVLLAEIPVSFEQEARKAQAVVARTYALKRSTVSPRHEECAVCMNPGCCQAYISPEQFLQKGGSREDMILMNQAVKQTRGQVLTYNGALIDATYFSCSGGTTEDAVAVWGMDIPYLQSKDSPGEENAAHYEDTVVLDRDRFQSLLGLELSGNPESWIGEIRHTAGGGVEAMEIGGTEFAGTELRKLLSLRSTDFQILPEQDRVTIITRGFGHRVGMSQYGAQAMALQGCGYAEILDHYYTGAELEIWENN